MSNILISVLALLQRVNTWLAAQTFSQGATVQNGLTANAATITGEASINGFGSVSQRLSKAWVKFSASGGTVAVGDSFNVSSVTRSGTGDFVMNLSAAMGNAEYSPQVLCNNADGIVYGPAFVSATASAFSFSTLKAFNVSKTDCSYNSVVIFGD